MIKRRGQGFEESRIQGLLKKRNQSENRKSSPVGFTAFYEELTLKKITVVFHLNPWPLESLNP
jgi:hypothetical protein